MSKRVEFNSEGSVPEFKGIVETAGFFPDGYNVKDPVFDAIHTWVNSSDMAKFSLSSLSSLSESLRQYSPLYVKKIIKEHFDKWERAEIRKALKQCGMLKESKKSLLESKDNIELKETADPKELLYTSLMFIPESESYLREQIIKFLESK